METHLVRALPLFYCDLIDAVAADEEFSDIVDEWEDWLSDYQTFFAEEEVYSLSELDQERLHQLPGLLQALRAQVLSAFDGAGDPDQLLLVGQAFFKVHDQFLRERLTPNFVIEKDLDSILKMSMCAIHGRCTLASIKTKLPQAISRVQSMSSKFQETDELALVEKTLSALNSLLELERLEDGFEDHAQSINSAWSKLEKRALSKMPADLGLPIIGQTLGELKREWNEKSLQTLREEKLPELLNHWDERSDGWLLKPESLDELISMGNELLSDFEDLVSQASIDQDSFWKKVGDLQRFFRLMMENRLAVEKLSLGPHSTLAELALGLLRGQCPRYAAYSLLESLGAHSQTTSALEREIADRIQDYLDSFEPHPLLTALELLLTELEQSKNTRICPNCGHREAITEKACTQCGQALQLELDVR